MRFSEENGPIIHGGAGNKKHFEHHSPHRGSGIFHRLKRLWDRIQFPDLSENKTAQFLEKYSLIFHGVLSCVLIFIIEWISRRSLTSAISFITGNPLAYLFNAMLIYVTLLFPYIFRRRGFFRLFISIFWLLLGIVNGCVLASRVTPFNFTDLKLVGDLLNMQNSKYFTAAQGVLAVAALVIVVLFLILYLFKGSVYRGPIHRIRNLIFFGLAVLAVPFVAKAAINQGILAGYFGNLAQGYSDYGFVYSFTASAADTGMRKPFGYSDNTIEKILKTSATAKTKTDRELPNIIFVQLESVVDPEDINFLETSKDPIPTLHALQENYSTGYLTVPIVGAGTVNTEFEVLTGMSIQFFGLGEYPYKTVLKDKTCESVAGNLSNLGYATHTLHNNGGNFYSRAKVFANMGFDSFTCKEVMNIQDYNELGSWPKDNILVGETEKILNSSKNQPDFLCTITVQSHGNYPDYQVFENPEITVSGGASEGEHYQWEYYVNELYQVDAFVDNLIKQLSARDEKTLLVLYGDHLPTMGLTDEDMKSGDIYKTRYYTWNNFGLEKKDQNLYSYQLMAHMLDQLDIHEGTIFKYHQHAMQKGQTQKRTYLSNLNMLQYDLLYGEHYAYHGKDLYPASDMVIGIDDVNIQGCSLNYDQDKFIIRGKNFTPWSVVYVNNKKVDTEFISQGVLQISRTDLNSGDSYVVHQLGSSATIFRSSNTCYYYDIPKTDTDKKTTAHSDTDHSADNRP